MSKVLRPEDISDDGLKIPSRPVYRVLLVHRQKDGNSIVLTHLSRTACDEFVFRSVPTVTDAIARLKESSFDLVVLGVDAPQGQEFEGFFSLQKAYPDLPIVILSDTKDHDLSVSASKHGVHDFIITSPSYPMELVRLRLLYSIERSRFEKTQLASAKIEKFVLRSVVENSPLMFMRLDENSLLRDCNKNLEKALGLGDRSQLRNQALINLIPEFEKAEIDFLCEGNQLLGKKVVANDKDCYWNCVGWPYYGTDSEKECIIVAIDVSQEVLLERLREEFLVAVAHDIKNPILGQERVLSSILKSSKDLPPEIQSSIVTLRNTSVQLLTLLNSLVDVYRMEGHEATNLPCAASLNDIVEQQFEELNSIAGATGKGLILSLEAHLPRAAIEASAASRVVSNLVHNALQHAPANTEISVRTSSTETQIVLEVNNQGPPISETDLPKLFQRFTSGANGNKNRNYSSGLGLYLCKQTVERFGGNIFCVTDADQGTTFVVQLQKGS